MASDASGGQFEVHREDDLTIPVDGETVAATRFAPGDATDPLPTLLMYVPYHKDTLTPYTSMEPLIRYLVRSEYNVVVADVVGTGASSGTKAEPGSMDEGEHAARIVEWLADRAWSTGSVGMFGISYGGTTSLKAAAENPDALDAIVPIHGPHTQYRETYQGGSFALYRMGGNWTPYMQVLAALPPSRRDPDGRWADVWKARLSSLRDQEPWLFQFLEHESKDEYWRGKDVPVSRIAVPTFAVCGWRDRYARSTVEYFEAIDAPKRLLLGPWRHEMPHRGRETAVDFRRQVVEWFDHYLKDGDTAAPERPEIAVWTERDGGGTVGGGTWRQLDSWPEAGEGEDLAFAASPSGLVDATEFDAGEVEREYEIDHTVGVDSLDDVYVGSEPTDTNADDARSMSFETEPFESAVELTGTGEARLRITSTVEDPYLAVRLLDVSPDGSATLVTHGELRAKHRRGFDESDELTPGTEYAVTVPLKPKSHVFEPGHRLRVAVSGAYFPLNFPSREQGALVLSSAPESPSVVRFPGRTHGDGATFDDAIAMSGPDETVPRHPQRVHGERSTWRVTRDHLNDSATVVTADAFDADLPHASLSFSEEVTADVVADDPASAAIQSDIEASLDYPTETVTVRATSRVTRDVADIDLTVRVDGQTVFEHRWHR
ncbi:CocE/NonD family hydrolase [Halorussus halobius]|uniref:CocE/NonD family hydrolase n=1 Tax=Halorussus halobius TaxID=1710537 RepID=UPI0010922DEF|nr:CocE/NonD family hydrolase [Halorussus halobius]